MNRISDIMDVIRSKVKKLPPDIAAAYIRERLEMLTRGMAIFHKPCFIGRNVEIKCRGRIKIGRFVTIHSNTYIDACSERGIILEDGVTIGKNSYVRTGNIESSDGYLIMRRGSSFNYGCFIGATGGIEIGENVLMGPNITIITEKHNFDDPESFIREQGVEILPVKIEDDVWIGANVTILGGVTIGRGAIIGAKSLVNKDAKPFSIYVGIPARKLRERK